MNSPKKRGRPQKAKAVPILPSESAQVKFEQEENFKIFKSFSGLFCCCFSIGQASCFRAFFILANQESGSRASQRTGFFVCYSINKIPLTETTAETQVGSWAWKATEDWRTGRSKESREQGHWHAWTTEEERGKHQAGRCFERARIEWSSEEQRGKRPTGSRFE